jgi:hypothetical protein
LEQGVFTPGSEMMNLYEKIANDKFLDEQYDNVQHTSSKTGFYSPKYVPQQFKMERGIRNLQRRGAKPELIEKRERELEQFKQRKAAKAQEIEARRKPEVERDEKGRAIRGGGGQNVTHEGQLTVQLTGMEGLAAAAESSNNVNIGQGVAAGLRVVADNIDGSDGSPQSTAAALRAGAESQVMVAQG